MNATFTKQLTGLLLTLGLLLNALALPLYASTQLSPRPSADKSRAGLPASKPVSQTVPTETARRTKEQASEAYGKLPVSFEANQGQTDPAVKFMARGNGYNLFLTATGAVLSLRKDAQENPGRKLSREMSRSKASSLRSDVSSSSSTASLRMHLVGANADPHVSGQEQLAGKINYLTGSNRGDWHGDIPNFAKVKYEQVYPGVDMVYYGNQRQLEYDFVLAPGANPNLIKLAFEGTRLPRIAANGDLLLRTSIGELRQHKPVAYQETGGTRQTIAARYVIKNGQVGFQVADYDKSKPLVIDPILSYSTYLGGSGSYEVSFGVAVDADGNAYVAGTTASADYPLTPGALQPAVGGNNSEGDAFVTKLNATGTALVYSTYLGGSARDFAYDIAVDADGNAYVTGATSSYDFPTTPGAFQSAHAAGAEVDSFVAKLNPTGTALVYSTYLGGSNNEDVHAIKVNSLGEAYVAGATPSLDFPTTPGAYRTEAGGVGGNADVFVTKLNATGTALVYSTSIGAGSATAYDLALDSAGNVYVGGVTYASAPAGFTFPVTPNAYQSNPGGEGFEGFISELNADGSQLLYSTYLGGSMEDAVIGITTDASNRVYVAGYTGSSDFPVTTGCAQATFGGPYDTFITKFNLASPGAASLIYSTYLGGSNLEDPKGIAVDSAGNAYVAGYTQSNDYPVTESLGATGFLNAFAARLNADGTQFLDSVRFGDTYTYAYGLALDSSGNAYVVGQTTSYSFPVTTGAVQTTLAGGGSDSFVTKLDFVTRQADLAVNFRPGPPQVTPGSPDIYVMDVSNNGPHPANNVVLTDELPAGVSFLSASPIEGASGSCNAAGNTVTCDLGNLNPNSSAAVIIAVNVTAPSGTTLVNVASVGSTTSDPNTANNSASFTTEVLALADLSINAAVQPQNFVANGASITYTVNATNNGPNTASATAISGTLPSAVTFNNIINSYGTCTTAPDGNGNMHFDCSLGDTDSGVTKTITFAGVVNGAPYTQLPFFATVGSTTQDPADYNNNAATGVQISSPPLLAPTPGPGGDAQLAYAIHDPNTFQGDIFRQRADGAGLLNLTNNASAYGEFIWSPDGSKLAFVRAEQFGNDANLYVMNADGTNQVRLTNDSSELDFGVAWSPDGTRLAFTAYHPIGNTTGVHTINADGSNLRVLTTTTGNDSSISWSPDGTRLSFTHSVFDFQSGSFLQSINVMNADGTNQITFNQSGGEIDYNPAWSPDGSLIAFVRLPNDGLHGPDIFTAHPDGTNIHNLTNDYSVSFNAPRWSPDGSKLSFLSAPGNALTMLTVMNADGSGRASISGSIESISSNQGWSPDGSKLAFIVSYGEVYNGIYVVNANGTGLTHIGDDIERNNDPVWSPDSTKLAFTSTRNSQASIDLVQANGTGRVELARDAYSPRWRPAPPPNTPAGSNVAVTQNGVRLTFSNVTTAGETTVTPIDPNSLTGVPGEYVINANSLAFEIHTTAVYTGTITIGFQVPGVNNPITFSALRVLHGEPPPVPNFVDRTVLAPATPAPDFATRTIYARVTSLSPFIVTERKSDTTPPDILITRPADVVYLLNQAVTASYSCTDAGSGVAQCTGPVASGAGVNMNAAGSFSFTVNARDNAGNTAARTVNYRVAYGVNPLFDQTKANKSGSTIPIKLELVDAAGVNRSAANIVVAALSVVRISDNAPGTLAAPGNSNPDLDFKYQSGGYQFNLKTTGYATGTYRLNFRAGNDPTVHAVQFQVK